MILKRLSILNYRNLRAADLQFSPHVNCLVGSNGMGKSNVLDAIHYLAFCRGFASAQDGMNVHHEADCFLLEGNFERETSVPMQVCCALKRGSRKRLKVDGKDVKRLSEHIGRIPLVMIAPADSELITGGSESRRHFMDVVIMQYNPSYLEALMRYERALKQRNVLLKQEDAPDDGVMEVLEEMMSDAAAVICRERSAFVAEFQPLFGDLYGRLSGQEGEVVEIAYESHSSRGELKPQLAGWRERERIVGYTLHGPHKDDLLFTLGGYGVKREASQGQQKTFFIALKLAQYTFLKQKGEQRAPLLLLDDIFDKLDVHRVANIVQYVSSADFGQIFITDTSRDHLNGILAATERSFKLFEVENGEVRSLEFT